jgi:hypothetical protein
MQDWSGAVMIRAVLETAGLVMLLLGATTIVACLLIEAIARAWTAARRRRRKFDWVIIDEYTIIPTDDVAIPGLLTTTAAVISLLTAVRFSHAGVCTVRDGVMLACLNGTLFFGFAIYMCDLILENLKLRLARRLVSQLSGSQRRDVERIIKDAVNTNRKLPWWIRAVYMHELQKCEG